MDEDIQFALAVLKRDYKKRREALISDNTLTLKDKDSALTGLEVLLSAQLKIKAAFKGEE